MRNNFLLFHTSQQKNCCSFIIFTNRLEIIFQKLPFMCRNLITLSSPSERTKKESKLKNLWIACDILITKSGKFLQQGRKWKMFQSNRAREQARVKEIESEQKIYCRDIKAITCVSLSLPSIMEQGGNWFIEPINKYNFTYTSHCTQLHANWRWWSCRTTCEKWVNN